MAEERDRVTAATAAVSAQSGFGPPPGTILFEKYRVESLLGLGGSGVVVKATELATGDSVAVKLLRDDVHVDDDTRMRLMREAAAAVRLRSDHAAKVRDVGTYDGQPFMVMELLQGMDLGRLLHANTRLDTQFAVELGFQVCDALAEAHGIGIIHRDVKPSNLFVTWLPDGAIRTKVLDFGISKTPTNEGLVITSRAAVLGTPTYMSPEQMRSASNVDVRTDIWSLGAVLFEMIEGRPPFVGANYADMCVLVSTEPAPPLSQAPALDAIVQKCLVKDPAGRYGSIAELANALAPHMKDPQGARAKVPKLYRLAGKPAPFTSAQMDAVRPSVGGPELALATGTPLPKQASGPRPQVDSGPLPKVESGLYPPVSDKTQHGTPGQPRLPGKQASEANVAVRMKQPSGAQPVRPGAATAATLASAASAASEDSAAPTTERPAFAQTLPRPVLAPTPARPFVQAITEPGQAAPRAPASRPRIQTAGPEPTTIDAAHPRAKTETAEPIDQPRPQTEPTTVKAPPEPRIPIAAGSDPAMNQTTANLDDAGLEAGDTIHSAPFPALDTLEDAPDPNTPIPPSDLEAPAIFATATPVSNKLVPPDAAAARTDSPSARSNALGGVRPDAGAAVARTDSPNARSNASGGVRPDAAAARTDAPGARSNASGGLRPDAARADGGLPSASRSDVSPLSDTMPAQIVAAPVREHVIITRAAPRKWFDATGIAILLLVLATIALVVVFQLGLLD